MEKSARCGFLHARLSPSQCQPTALGSAGPACPTRLLPAHRRKEAPHRANRPIEKSPALALECRGFFCFALMGGMPERHFRFPQQLPQKVENSPLCGLLPDAGGLLTSPLVSGVPLQGGALHQANCPHPKIPGTRSGMPGIFLFRSDERHAGGALPLSTSAAAEGGKLSLYGLLPGAGGLAHRPALFRRTAARERTAPGKLPHPKIPGTHSGMPGIFYPFTAAVPGVTSARRSHGLPL